VKRWFQNVGFKWVQFVCRYVSAASAKAAAAESRRDAAESMTIRLMVGRCTLNQVDP
jgi:hypothetical protein